MSVVPHQLLVGALVVQRRELCILRVRHLDSTPSKEPLLVYHFACLVDAVMSYYLIGYGNMPCFEMIVNQYCKETQENYVLYLIKLF